MKESYCVYRHIRKDTNLAFYIGISKNMERPYDKWRRSAFWKKIVNKTNYVVDILATNLDKETAMELEVFLIQEYGRINLKTGILCNLTDGGESRNNVVISEETKKKLSKHSKNLKRTKEWYKKVSKSLIGKKLSAEHKKKLSIAKKGKASNRRKKVIDTETKEIFTSILEASKKSKYNCLSYYTIKAQLSGQSKNKTTLIYYKND